MLEEAGALLGVESITMAARNALARASILQVGRVLQLAATHRDEIMNNGSNFGHFWCFCLKLKLSNFKTSCPHSSTRSLLGGPFGLYWSLPDSGGLLCKSRDPQNAIRCCEGWWLDDSIGRSGTCR